MCYNDVLYDIFSKTHCICAANNKHSSSWSFPCKCKWPCSCWIPPGLSPLRSKANRSTAGQAHRSSSRGQQPGNVYSQGNSLYQLCFSTPRIRLCRASPSRWFPWDLEILFRCLGQAWNFIFLYVLHFFLSTVCQIAYFFLCRRRFGTASGCPGESMLISLTDIFRLLLLCTFLKCPFLLLLWCCFFLDFLFLLLRLILCFSHLPLLRWRSMCILRFHAK